MSWVLILQQEFVWPEAYIFIVCRIVVPARDEIFCRGVAGRF